MCGSCESTIEKIVKISEIDSQVCEECGEFLIKLDTFGKSKPILNVGGFYDTDYKTTNKGEL